MTKSDREVIIGIADVVDKGWWYSAIPEYIGKTHKDIIIFGNPIIWDKLRRTWEAWEAANGYK